MTGAGKIIALFFITVISVGFGQDNSTIKALKIKLAKLKTDDTLKANVLNSLAWEYGYFDPGTSMDYCRKALALSNQLDFDDGRAEAYNVMGNNSRAIGRYDSALYFLNRALAIRKAQGNVQRQSAAMINIANVYWQQKSTAEAILKYNEAIKLAESSGFPKGMLVGLTNLSDAYRSVGFEEKALQALNQALKINKTVRDTLQEPYIYTTMASLLREMDDYQAAAVNGRKALALLSNHPDLYLKTTVLNNLGTYYRDLEKYDSSMVYLSKALEIETQLNDSIGLAITNNGIALLYQRQNQFDFCLAFAQKAKNIARDIGDTPTYYNSTLVMADVYTRKKNYARALELAREVEQTVLASNNKKSIYEMYASFSEIYKGLGMHDKSAESLEKVIAYRDSVLSDENKRITQKLNIELDVYGKEKEIELLNKTTELKEAELSRQKSARLFITGIAGLFGIVIIVTVFFFIRIRKSNIIINKQKERVESQNEIILHQKQLVEEKQKEIIDSINYAKRIQSAVLTSEQVWKKISPDHFILFQPKDIVSGDFYWAYNAPNGRSIFALADCTGHGVPGGFMSMLGNSFLNEIVVENKIFSASAILNKLREKVIASLEQKGDEQRKDGMDIALCVWNRLNNTLEFAGANNSLMVIKKGTLTELKADKMPIGHYLDEYREFTSQTIQLEAGDCLYMTTDGYPDQFGGPKGKKFKYKQTEELLLQHCLLPMKEQGEILEKNLISWKGSLEQVDDICFIGVRIS